MGDVRAIIEWGEESAPFRLSQRTGPDAIIMARLQTPDGEVLDLPATDWLNLARAIQRLLGDAAARLKRVQRAPQLPEHAGKSWTPQLNAELRHRWEAGEGVKQLALLFGRTDGSISSRLVRLGLVQPPSTIA